MTGKGLERFRVLTAAALNIFVLYSPQPLLPLYANLYNISEPTAGLIMTATILPLAVAPLSYGYVLNTIQTLKLLRASLLLAVLHIYSGPGLRGIWLGRNGSACLWHGGCRHAGRLFQGKYGKGRGSMRR